MRQERQFLFASRASSWISRWMTQDMVGRSFLRTAGLANGSAVSSTVSVIGQQMPAAAAPRFFRSIDQWTAVNLRNLVAVACEFLTEEGAKRLEVIHDRTRRLTMNEQSRRGIYRRVVRSAAARRSESRCPPGPLWQRGLLRSTHRRLCWAAFSVGKQPQEIILQGLVTNSSDLLEQRIIPAKALRKPAREFTN